MEHINHNLRISSNMAYEERIYPGIKWNIDSKVYRRHAGRYEFASKFVSGKKVLDIACGSGYGSKILCDAGATEVYGCDLDEEGIRFARKNYANQSIKFQVMDASKMTFDDNSFDCIVSFETIEHVLDYKNAVKGFYRILKDDGTLIISTPNKEIVSEGRDKPKNPFHMKEFTRDEFLGFLGQDFVNIRLFSQRLQIEISTSKKIIRNFFMVLVRLDFLKLYMKFRNTKLYDSIEYIIDDTANQYFPIPYQSSHNPTVFIAVCQKRKR